MLIDFTSQFFLVSAITASVGLAGLVGLLVRSASLAIRLLLTAAAATLPIIGLSLIEPDRSVFPVAFGAVAGILLFVEFLGLKAITSMLSDPRWRQGGVVVLCGLTFVGAGIWYDRALDKDSNDTLREKEFGELSPALEVCSSPALTDNGHAVEPSSGQ